MKLYQYYKHSPRTNLILFGLLFLFLIYDIILLLKEGIKYGSNILSVVIVSGFLSLALINKYSPNSKIAKKGLMISIIWLIASVISLSGIFAWQYFKTIGEEVSIVTDKNNYQQGEIVKIIIKNNLNKSIWYRDNTGHSVPLVDIQIFHGGEWKNVEKKDACACRKNCFQYTAGWGPQKPKELTNDSWDTKTDCTGIIVEEGKYRALLRYSLDPSGLGEFINAYSKEFVVE